MRFGSSWGAAMVAAAALCGAGIACKPAQGDQVKEAKKELPALTVDEVKAGIDKGDLAVFDNNSPKRYAESHVPTAKWVNYHDLKKADLPQDTSKRLVFYCANEH